VPEAIISRSLLRVLEHVIGFADRLEPGLLVGTAAVAVGMALHRDSAVRSLDRRRICAAIDPEQSVEIGLSHDDS